MAKQVPNIYIVGPQCTGKTTLVNAVEKDPRLQNETNTTLPQPRIIKEVARCVLQKYHFTAADIRDDPERCLGLQELILCAQHESETSALREAPWLVSDRSGVDPIVYALMHVGAWAAGKMLESDAWKSLRGRMATSLVILCEPSADWLLDDGVRLMPLDMEEWTETFRTFRALLEREGVEYHVVPSVMSGLEERVNFVLSRWKVLGQSDLEDETAGCLYTL
ncbi:hypothetical protein SODALDRAFT_327131 [Sodiomyces alkalinus F11]|uniref:NadR/Ttd14 AAA domain-containing protein n=1 Tax=Sodiomyces alkalinus (strain CBS 110278 / VKM F-3762 / F11) TaxID=1314773 RepID=A0A3N2Q8A6_SODAK|nr:hypothetical protein SODALDRAFT_327131 [Sodiomyces alkalinus F11]ROT42966.1 hypothetical protein SODALDRAFT_327131 [Sodiomyces alkalinus F11]